MNTNNNTPKQKESNNNIRFTFLINPTLLSQIKLISYISNQKLYETINQSISDFINNYNKSHNTDISNLINLNSQTPTTSSPLNPITTNQSNQPKTK